MPRRLRSELGKQVSDFVNAYLLEVYRVGIMSSALQSLVLRRDFVNETVLFHFAKHLCLLGHYAQ
jgi:hypothetical protein